MEVGVEVDGINDTMNGTSGCENCPAGIIYRAVTQSTEAKICTGMMARCLAGGEDRLRFHRGKSAVHVVAQKRRSLDVYEEVALEDVLALFVSLRSFVGTIVFPPQGGGTLDTVDVPNGVVASRHQAVVWLAFDHVDHSLK